MNRSRPRSLWRRVIPAISVAFISVTAIGSALCAPSGGGADIPPGTPPAIAEIMQKVQRGGRPSMADIAKLQAWAQKLTAKVNGPVGNGSQYRPPTHTASGSQAAAERGEQAGIPCTVHVTFNYDGRGNDATANGQAQYTASAMLYPRIGGAGDYWATLMSPDAKVSSFRFEPLATDSGAAIAKTGGGSYHSRSTGAHGTSSESTGVLTQGVFSMMLVTTGKGDLLYPSGGGGGVAKGKVTTRDKDRTVTYNGGDIGGGPGEPFPAENAQLGPGKSTPIPKMSLSYRALLAAIRSGGTAVVQGSESASNIKLGGLTYSSQSTIQITLRPKPMEIIVEPFSKRVYEAWEPMPDADDTGHADLFGSPEPLAVHLVMHDESKPNAAPGAGGLTKPNTQIGGLIDVHLDEVSDQPGICMNYPEDAAAKKGLFFPEHQPTGIKWIDGQHIQTMSATALEAMVYVCARDTGAYGHLDADCEALGLECKNYKTTDKFLSIPLDDDDNHIADQYEKANNIYDKKLPPDWDEEDKPTGWRSTGDGLSLYEEYRGFLTDNPDHTEKFQRLSQGKRKEFVFPVGVDKEIYRKGAEIFRNASGLDIYYLHDRSRMKDMDSAAFPRWINFNKTLWSNYQQAGVWMQDLNSTSTAFTRPRDDSPDSVAQYPKTVDSIIISRAAITEEIDNWSGLFPPNLPLDKMGKKMKEACTNGHIDVAQAEATMQARKPSLVDSLIMFSAAHELGHSVGGRHHGLQDYLTYLGRNSPTDEENGKAQSKYYSSGDQECLMRYWHFDPDWTQWMLFLSGKWNLVTPASGGKWGFCTEDTSNMHLKE